MLQFVYEIMSPLYVETLFFLAKGMQKDLLFFKVVDYLQNKE